MSKFKIADEVWVIDSIFYPRNEESLVRPIGYFRFNRGKISEIKNIEYEGTIYYIYYVKNDHASRHYPENRVHYSKKDAINYLISPLLKELEDE